MFIANHQINLETKSSIFVSHGFWFLSKGNTIHYTKLSASFYQIHLEYSQFSSLRVLTFVEYRLSLCCHVSAYAVMCQPMLSCVSLCCHVSAYAVMSQPMLS